MIGGVGLGFSEDNDRTPLGATAAAPQVELKDHSLAWSAGVGVEYFIAPNISLGVESKYLSLTTEADVDEVSSDFDVGGVLLMGGIRFFYPEVPRGGELGSVNWRRAGIDDRRGYLAVRVGYFGRETGGAFFWDKYSNGELFLETPSGEAIASGSVGVALGRYWAVEFAADLIETELMTPEFGKVAEYSIYTLLGQVRFQYPLRGDRLIPYVVAGGGVGFAELNDRRTDARLKVEGDARESVVRLPRVPGSDYFAARGGAEALEPYWRETLLGIAAGYDARMEVSWSHLSSQGEWMVTWTYGGDLEKPVDAPPEDPFANATAYVRLSRRTFGVFAALCMYAARSLTERFDATGEQVVREALYNFGVERARGMREEVLAEGKPLNFRTFFDNIQRRDPKAATFVFGGHSRISPGVFQVTCTYCPCAEVWSEEGRRGLDFGYIYDMEVHRGLVEGFHPGGVVMWDKLKTRGDRVCDFRFFIPELVGKEDPEWARTRPAPSEPD